MKHQLVEGTVNVNLYTLLLHFKMFSNYFLLLIELFKQANLCVAIYMKDNQYYLTYDT